MYTTPNKTSLKFGIYYLLKLLLWLLKIPTVISFLVLVLVRGGGSGCKKYKITSIQTIRNIPEVPKHD